MTLAFCAGCGDQTLRRDFEELANSFMDDATFAAIDCEKLPETAKEAGVTQHPTYQVLHEVRSAVPFSVSPCEYRSRTSAKRGARRAILVQTMTAAGRLKPLHMCFWWLPLRPTTPTCGCTNACVEQGSAVGKPAFDLTNLQAEIEEAIKRYAIVDLS